MQVEKKQSIDLSVMKEKSSRISSSGSTSRRPEEAALATSATAPLATVFSGRRGGCPNSWVSLSREKKAALSGAAKAFMKASSREARPLSITNARTTELSF